MGVLEAYEILLLNMYGKWTMCVHGAHNLILFPYLEHMIGLSCLMSMFIFLTTLIKKSQYYSVLQGILWML